MRFLEPVFLYVLPALLAFCFAAFGIGWHLRRVRLRRFLTAELVARVDRQVAKGWVLARHVLLLVSVAALACALARPVEQGNTDLTESTGIDVLIAIDLSRSMDATDMQSSRFAATRAAILRLMERHPEDRFALIAFAGDAAIQSPLTRDHAAVTLVLESLRPGATGVPGTNLGSAITEGARLVKQRELGPAVLMLFTDGENLEGDALEAARSAGLEHQLSVFTVGVGTSEGSTIPVGADTGDLVRDASGTPVLSRLDESLLHALALVGGGRYVRLGETPDAFIEFYTDTVRPTATQRSIEEPLIVREWYYPLAAIAFALLFVEPLLPMRKSAMRLAVLLLILPLHAQENETSPSEVAIVSDPATAAYNEGVSYYAAGEFDQAARVWREVAAHGSRALAARALAQGGNAQVRLGERLQESNPEAAVAFWEEALRLYQSALERDSKQDLAQQNLPVVQERTVGALRSLAQKQAEENTPEALRQAIRYVERALDILPDSPDLADQRSALESQLERTLLERARDLTVTARELESSQRDAASDAYRQAIADLEIPLASEDEALQTDATTLSDTLNDSLAENLLEAASQDASAASQRVDTLDSYLGKMQNEFERRQLAGQLDPLRAAVRQVGEAEAKIDEAIAAKPDDPTVLARAEQTRAQLASSLAKAAAAHEALATRLANATAKAAELDAARLAYEQARALAPSDEELASRQKALEDRIATEAQARADALASQAEETLEIARVKESADLREMLLESPNAAAAERGFESPEAQEALEALAREQEDLGGFRTPGSREAAERAAELYQQAANELDRASALDTTPDIEAKTQALRSTADQLQARLDQSASDSRNTPPSDATQPEGGPANAAAQLEAARKKITFSPVAPPATSGAEGSTFETRASDAPRRDW